MPLSVIKFLSGANHYLFLFSSDEDISVSNSLPKEDDFYSDDYEQVREAAKNGLF